MSSFHPPEWELPCRLLQQQRDRVAEGEVEELGCDHEEWGYCKGRRRAQWHRRPRQEVRGKAESRGSKAALCCAPGSRWHLH